MKKNIIVKYLGCFLLFTFSFSCSKKLETTPVVIIPPSAPNGISAIPGNTRATISFTPPANTGGSGITGYTITSIPSSITAYGVQSPITITGLTNGISYTFTVTAANSAGIGAVSNQSNSITPTDGVVQIKNCSILAISRFNNGAKSDYAMTVFYDYVNRPIRMILFDSLRNKKEYEANFDYQSDAIKIDQYQSFKIDPTTKQVKSFTTKADLTIPNSDILFYEYFYNDLGFLIEKRNYLNGSKIATYKTNYIYDANNLLIGCLMYLASSNVKILESVITYDISQPVNNAIYAFPDGFESYMFTPIFNYGKKMKYPVKSMITKLYDPSNSNLLDTWNSIFSSYSYSSDGNILQGTQSGDLQQGFSLFYGKTSFTYLCQ